MESKRFTLNRTDLESLGRGLLITLVGALLTYVSENIPSIELGEWTPMVVAFWALVANTVRKFMSGK